MTARSTRPARHRPPRRRPLLVLLALLAVAAGVLGWAAYAGLQARTELLAAREVLTTVDTSDPASPALRSSLDTAAGRTSRAVALLRAPGPRLVASVPLLGRSLAAQRDVAVAADALTQGGRRVLPLFAALDVEGGRIDIGALDELSEAATDVDARVADAAERLAGAPLGLTPGVVRSAVADARSELLPAADGLSRAAAGLRATQGLLGAERPRTVVIGLMNNAEARGAGGYVASFAVARFEGGQVAVDGFRDVNTVATTPAEAVRVPASPDFQRRWGRFLADTTLWKNVAMSPHVPDSASVLCEVARLRPGVACDGAVLLDVRALADLMSLSGPVTVGGEQLTGPALMDALLVEAYADAEQLGQAPAERRAGLLAAADAALGDLLSARLTGASALRLLGDLAAGRHVSVWSAVAEEQADLLRAGAAGSVDPAGADLSLVSLNQLSAGKLDVYLRRELSVQVTAGPREAVVEQRVVLELDHPAGLPAYVLGVRGGRLDHLVDLGMAADARDVSLVRDGVPEPFELVRDDRGSSRASFVLSLRSPQRVELVLRYTTAAVDGRYRLRLVPQPLARDAPVRVTVSAAPGARVEGPGVVVDGPLDRERSVEVQAERPSWWDRPVELPF